MRYGRTLGFHEPFFYKLVDVLADTMGDVFPEIRAQDKQHVEDVIQREEEAFNKTLDQGHRRSSMKRYVRRCMTRGESQRRGRSRTGNASDSAVRDSRTTAFPATFAFKLYDTYGFPLDLTELMARERGLTVDMAGFEKLMEEQRDARAHAQKKERHRAVADRDRQRPPSSSATSTITPAQTSKDCRCR